MHCLSTSTVWHCQRCRHAHDGGAAGALGEAHGGSRCQPVHIPPGGHGKPRQPHQGHQRERHEGEDDADWASLVIRLTRDNRSLSLIDKTPSVLFPPSVSSRLESPLNQAPLWSNWHRGPTRLTWLWWWRWSLVLEGRSLWRTWCQR